MIYYINKFIKDSISFLLFCLIVVLFLFSDQVKNLSIFTKVPGSFLNVNTIFLSIILEAIPFYFIRSKTNYNGSTVPLIKIQKLSLIAAPKQPYVFDAGVKIE
jgi:hypothetical protein